MTKSLADLIDGFQDFMQNGTNRLINGDSEYNGSAESREPCELIQEIEEELTDVAVWSYLLLRRVRALSGKVSNMEDSADTQDYIVFDVDDNGQYIDRSLNCRCKPMRSCTSCSCHHPDPDEN